MSSPEPFAAFETASALILNDLRDRVGLETWFISRRDGDNQVILLAVDGGMGVHSGGTRSWPDSFCSRMIEGRAPMAAPDLDLVPAYVEARERNGLPVRACVSVPITAPGGETIGTLCGLAGTPWPDLEAAMPAVHLHAQILGVMLSNELRLAEEVRRAERSDQVAHQDGLTGISNRRAWDVALSNEEGRAARFGTTATIAVLDLDGLKQVNDQWGHEAGDELLVKTAEEITARLRGSDVLARLGGDEFGLLLPQTTQAQGQDVVDDVLARLADVGIAVSAGVTQRTAGGGLVEAWRQADALMYESKTRRKPNRRPSSGPRPVKDSRQPGSPTVDSIDAVLELVRGQLNVDVAFVNRFEGAQRQFRNVVSTVDLPLNAGDVEPREGSYCQMIVDGRIPYVIPDVAGNDLLKDLPVTSRLGIGSYVGVPLRNQDGTLYGTLCAFSAEENHDLSDRDAQVLRGVGDLVMRLVDAEDTHDARRHDFLRGMDRLAARGDLLCVYQPVHSLDDLSVVGFEALSRFPSHGLSPAEWFAKASQYGVGPDLELSAIRIAVTVLPALEGFLSLNASPTTILTPEFARLVEELPLTRVVLEITEHEQIEDYDLINAVLQPLRERGLRVAIDDAGAGFASMQHILAIVPDFIKLDISLVRGIDRHPARQALAASLSAFGFKTNATLIAEGIETREELNCLRELNIEYGQGFHLSRPDPVPQPHTDSLPRSHSEARPKT